MKTRIVLVMLFSLLCQVEAQESWTLNYDTSGVITATNGTITVTNDWRRPANGTHSNSFVRLGQLWGATNSITDANSLTNITSSGAGTSLVYTVGNKLGQLKSLVPAGGFSIVDNGTSLTISASENSGEANTASNIGGGTNLFSSKVGVDLKFKSLLPGNNIAFSATDTNVTINSTGVATNFSNLGTGTNVFASFANGVGSFKSLLPGTGVTIGEDGSTITISSSAGSGEANTASNVGGGTNLFYQKSGVDLQFKSLVPGSGITLDATPTNITITSTSLKAAVTNALLAASATGTNIVSQVAQKIIRVKGLLPGNGVALADNGNDVTVGMSGTLGGTLTVTNIVNPSVTLTPALTNSINFDIKEQILTITNNTVFTFANANKDDSCSVTLISVANGASGTNTVEFPAMHWMGTNFTGIATNKVGRFSLRMYGDNAADVLGGWNTEP